MRFIVGRVGGLNGFIGLNREIPGTTTRIFEVAVAYYEVVGLHAARLFLQELRRGFKTDSDKFATDLLLPEDLVRKYLVEVAGCEAPSQSEIVAMARFFDVPSSAVTSRLKRFGITVRLQN